jgi:hypothetical protein
MKDMIGQIKSKLLNYLFNDWLSNQFDLETLQDTKLIIENRENKIKEITERINPRPRIGYVKY